MKGGKDKSALVLFSGGQDSTVCLAWALERYDRVETVAFNYGQRHDIELECRVKVLSEINALFPEWSERLGPDHSIDLSSLGQISETSLTRETEFEMAENGLPNTFVPARNLIFFVYAAALGYRRGITSLVGGMCETDFSGYPDCREKTLQTLAEAIRLGTDEDFTVVTPLMWLSKAQTWELSEEIGGKLLVEIVTEHTHSCYRGTRGSRHDWGYGCAACPACELRAKGHSGWREMTAKQVTA